MVCIRHSNLGVKGNRYAAYANTCADFKRCFATDFRDVYFQAHPFRDDQPGEDLLLQQEYVGQTIGSCPYNSGWIKSCWGNDALDYMKRKHIICSGTIMGNAEGFELLRQQMQLEFSKSKAKGPSCTARDQGHLNYL